MRAEAYLLRLSAINHEELCLQSDEVEAVGPSTSTSKPTSKGKKQSAMQKKTEEKGGKIKKKSAPKKEKTKTDMPVLEDKKSEKVVEVKKVSKTGKQKAGSVASTSIADDISGLTDSTEEQPRVKSRKNQKGKKAESPTRKGHAKSVEVVKTEIVIMNAIN